MSFLSNRIKLEISPVDRHSGWNGDENDTVNRMEARYLDRGTAFCFFTINRGFDWDICFLEIRDEFVRLFQFVERKMEEKRLFLGD